MKKKLIIGAIAVLLVLSSAMMLKAKITGNTTYEPVRMGYCPTMKEVAEKISSANHGLELVEQASSEHAISSLKSSLIDVALIGRLTKQKEMDHAEEMVLSQGYTIVSITKRFIQRAELASARVHTALDSDVAEQLLPGNEIAYYESTSDAVAKGLGEAVLISWDDYDDDYELVVVMDGSEKAKEFRIPVLYSLGHELGKIKVV